jgi:hypothetical protein
MKLRSLFIVVLAALLGISVSSKKGKSLKGKYIWHYKMLENEAMLIRQKTVDETNATRIEFKSNFTFSDARIARCGNDITYVKTGRYYLSNSKLILNYRGGKFDDNVGGNSKQIYVLGKVYYTIIRQTTDTIFLLKTKGDSEKKVSLLEKKLND